MLIGVDLELATLQGIGAAASHFIPDPQFTCGNGISAAALGELAGAAIKTDKFIRG